jgi:hypothetical protein
VVQVNCHAKKDWKSRVLRVRPIGQQFDGRTPPEGKDILGDSRAMRSALTTEGNRRVALACKGGTTALSETQKRTGNQRASV